MAISRAVTVTCPICKEVIEVPDYDGVDRSEALRRHLAQKHSMRGTGLRREEVEEIASRTANRVMEQIRYGGSEEVMSAAKDEMLGVGAYVLPERRGTKSPCSCCYIDPSGPDTPANRMCTTSGAIGTLSDSEERELCSEIVTLANGRCERARGLREAAARCKEQHPKDTEAFFKCYIPAFSVATRGGNPGNTPRWAR